jgi:hypothetical protein
MKRIYHSLTVSAVGLFSSEISGLAGEPYLGSVICQVGMHCSPRPIYYGILYVFRCAVYCASNENHDPELLKWWNWKDEAKAED